MSLVGDLFLLTTILSLFAIVLWVASILAGLWFKYDEYKLKKKLLLTLEKLVKQQERLIKK